jgi:hypothetical protein
VVTMVLFACTGSNNKDTSPKVDKFEVAVAEQEALKITTPEPTSNEDVVFYNLFSPLDMNKVIDQKSSYFNSAYVNSLNNITKYASSDKVALNIGIYGADLSYLWMFEQTQQAFSFFSAIQHLTTKLGIPQNFVQETFREAEMNSGNTDSLIITVRNAYGITDKYLKESDREGAAVLILLGGWIESMHIATNLYTEPNALLASKILTQKYSLNSLITIMQNNQDEVVMSEYLLLMKKLNDSFKKLESQLKPDDIHIDTINRRISIKITDNIKLNPSQFAEIKVLTAQIRDHIIR